MMQTKLATFLEQHGARRSRVWDDDGVSIEAYRANGRTFLLVRYHGSGDDGWDVFVPASPSINTGITLNALHEYISK
jgi:hypothetical protein